MASSSSSLADLHGCWEVRALAGFPRADEAARTLERVCAQVQPIMAAHRWKVPLVEEFFPSNPALQGMNVGGGAKILLRLRPASDRGAFLPWEHTLGTMLHELTHNEVGPHNDAFRKLLDALHGECDKLVDAGAHGT